MERLIEDLCEHCGEVEDLCPCYFSDYVLEEFEIKPRFEYAFENLTNENSVFKRNLPIK